MGMGVDGQEKSAAVRRPTAVPKASSKLSGGGSATPSCSGPGQADTRFSHASRICAWA